MEARSEGPAQLTPSKPILRPFRKGEKVERARPFRHARVQGRTCRSPPIDSLAATTGLIDLFFFF